MEDQKNCRTWRLNQIPQLDGPCVDALLISPHRLEWLDVQEAQVSGGRGFVKRLDGGFFREDATDADFLFIRIEIFGDEMSGFLEIGRNSCILRSQKT